MKLICPVNYEGKKFVEARITDPGGGVVADTNKVVQNDGNIFLALLTFARGNIVELITDNGEIENKANVIQAICRFMTYKTIEHLAIEQMVLYSEDDRVEGIYPCPLCGNKIRCEKIGDDDNTDRISDLEIIYQENNAEFTIEFENEFILKDRKGNELEVIKNMSFRHPEMQDMIDSYNMHIDDEVRMHYKVYQKCITKVNGNEITRDWITRYAKIFFETQKNKELNKISREINKIGIQGNIEKICNKCGKRFYVSLNTSNFFVSTLRSKKDI